jgi:hypothetical protein
MEMNTGQNQPFALYILSMEGSQTLNEIIATFCELRQAPLQIVIAQYLSLVEIAAQAERLGLEWMAYSSEPLADIPAPYRDRVAVGDVSPVWDTLQLRFPGRS